MAPFWAHSPLQMLDFGSQKTLGVSKWHHFGDLFPFKMLAFVVEIRHRNSRSRKSWLLGRWNWGFHDACKRLGMTWAARDVIDAKLRVLGERKWGGRRESLCHRLPDHNLYSGLSGAQLVSSFFHGSISIPSSTLNASLIWLFAQSWSRLIRGKTNRTIRKNGEECFQITMYERNS